MENNFVTAILVIVIVLGIITIGSLIIRIILLLKEGRKKNAYVASSFPWDEVSAASVADDNAAQVNLSDAQTVPIWDQSISYAGLNVQLNFILIAGQKTTRVEFLTKDTTFVGRSYSSDILIEDGTVSSTHILLKKDSKHLSVIDNHSSNGTLVNGIRIMGTAELASGDIVKIGRTEFSVQIM